MALTSDEAERTEEAIFGQECGEKGVEALIGRNEPK